MTAHAFTAVDRLLAALAAVRDRPTLARSRCELHVACAFHLRGPALSDEAALARVPMGILSCDRAFPRARCRAAR